MLSKPLVLIGPMGVGKTTIGKKLAKRLDLPFVDTDQVIIKEHGPIEQIFNELGESAFRRFEEAAVAKSLSQIQVVATGGGAILSEKTRKLLGNATVIYLSTDGRHIKSRLEGGNRPLLKNGFDDWLRIYEERKPIYVNLADIEIPAAQASLSKTVTQICEKLEQL